MPQPMTMDGLELCPLEESAALLKFTLRGAHAGSWAWDAITGEAFWSEEFHYLVGTKAETCQPSYESWLQTIHPEDRQRAAQEMGVALETGRELNNEFRILRPNGAVRWVRSQGRTLYDEGGKPLRMVGVTFDITERRLADEALWQAEAALRRSEERFHTAVETITDCFGVYSAVRNDAGEIIDFRIESVNNAACDNNLMQPQEQIGKLLCEILPAHRAGLFDEYCQVVETGEPLTKEAIEYEDEYSQRRLKRCFDIRAVKLGDGFVAAWRDVTERKRREESFRLQAEELTALTEALRDSDRRKDEFLAMLAHELRNPLAPIRNAVQVMRRLGTSDERVQHMRDVVDRQTDQLARMVDDLLDVSRVSLGKITLRKERADVLAIIGQAVETSRSLIDAGGHRLTLSLPEEPLHLEADVTRLAQVVANLLNNAAKYTEKGGHIQLIVETRGTEIQIRVKDNGIGIPAEILPHVFDLFAQADRTLDRAQGGLGIGLTLVQNIVEMHGGTVLALSDGPGQGAELIVELPRGIETPHPARSEAGDGAVERNSSLTYRRILVVDDDVDTAESLAVLLELGRHTVRTAHDGLRAVEVAKAFQPDIVLLDIGLPGISGYEVAVRLRAQPETRQALLIAVSGYGQDEDRQTAFDAGFDHYLLKPVGHETLNRLIQSPPGGSLRSSL